jgi:anti-sigma-K factor RskA
MKEEHIIEILDGAPLAALNERDVARIRDHTSSCDDCLRAYQAAQLTSTFLRERAAETFEPSPFFQTRVLALLREKRAAQDLWGLRRMWRAAGALVSSMAATVAILAVLSFVVPGDEATVNSNVISATNNYPVDAVYLDDNESQDDQSDAQVLTTLYESDEEGTR